MHAYAYYIVEARRQAMLAEAEEQRRARLIRAADGTVPAWRRTLGRGARGLSFAFGSAARLLDPCIEQVRSEGRGARPMAAA